MTSASPRLPKYRHYKPKNLAVVRINGRDVYLGRYNSTESREKYGRVIANWLETGMAPVPASTPEAEKTGPTVNEIILGFLKAHDGYYRRADGTPTGELDNFKDSLRPLKKLLGTTAAKDFSPKKLKLVRQGMVKAGLARSTINQRVGRIRHVFKWAESEEMIPAGIYHALMTVDGLRKGRTDARETDPVKPVADALVDAIRPHVSRQVWAMIELQRLTGMRPGEVCIMRTCDLETSGRVWVYRPSRHKTEHHEKGRAIQIGPKAQAVLKPWLKTDLSAYLFSPAEARAERVASMREKRKTRVQPSQRNRRKRKAKRRPGQRYTTHTYNNAIRRACVGAFPHPELSSVPADQRTPEQSARLKEWQRERYWHPNQLRHNAATYLRREFDLDTARAVLGHSKADTTEIYAERDAAIASQAIERVG